MSIRLHLRQQPWGWLPLGQAAGIQQQLGLVQSELRLGDTEGDITWVIALFDSTKEPIGASAFWMA
jgi:hypothetical protein